MKATVKTIIYIIHFGGTIHCMCRGCSIKSFFFFVQLLLLCDIEGRSHTVECQVHSVTDNEHYNIYIIGSVIKHGWSQLPEVYIPTFDGRLRCGPFLHVASLRSHASINTDPVLFLDENQIYSYVCIATILSLTHLHTYIHCTYRIAHHYIKYP